MFDVVQGSEFYKKKLRVLKNKITRFLRNVSAGSSGSSLNALMGHKMKRWDLSLAALEQGDRKDLFFLLCFAVKEKYFDDEYCPRAFSLPAAAA